MVGDRISRFDGKKTDSTLDLLVTSHVNTDKYFTKKMTNIIHYK